MFRLLTVIKQWMRKDCIIACNHDDMFTEIIYMTDSMIYPKIYFTSFPRESIKVHLKKLMQIHFMEHKLSVEHP